MKIKFWFEGLTRFDEPAAQNYWLIIGRHQADNHKIKELARPEDCLINFPRLPAPLALARFGSIWPKDILISAGQLALSYANKALQVTNKATLRAQGDGLNFELTICANRDESWALPSWEMIAAKLRESRKAKIAAAENARQERRAQALAAKDAPPKDDPA